LSFNPMMKDIFLANATGIVFQPDDEGHFPCYFVWNLSFIPKTP